MEDVTAPEQSKVGEPFRRRRPHPLARCVGEWPGSER